MNLPLFQRLRLLPFFVVTTIASACVTIPANADTWSDSTGKFQIEADYIGVEGTSVVLRKSDGSTLAVPIARLSPDSRARAKRLFEMAKPGTDQVAAAPKLSATSTAKSSSYTPQSQYTNLVAPVPPEIGKMAPFPSNPTLQQQLDYMKQQVLAGHLEVFWYVLPDDLRDTLDSQEFREAWRPAFERMSEQNAGFDKTMAKVVEVLTTKKQFVLGSPMLAAAPKQIMPTIEQGYDPVVGVLYEFLSLTSASKGLAETPATEFVDYHAPRIGAHLKALIPLVPPGEVDKFLAQIVVEQTGDSAGTLTVPAEGGGTETEEMVVYSGRWLPRQLVDRWTANQETFLSQARQMAESDEAQYAMSPEVAAMFESMATQMNTTLDTLAAASTQQEFDQTMMQAMQPLMMLGGAFGGAGPGGPGPPGGPGGGFGAPPAGF
jgi:hypothetical protein